MPFDWKYGAAFAPLRGVAGLECRCIGRYADFREANLMIFVGFDIAA